MSEGIRVEFDAEQQILDISRRLGALKGQTPAILKNSINAAARKVRKQMVKDAEGKYAITNRQLMKDAKLGAPRLQTAKPSDPTAIIRSKGPMSELSDFLVNPTAAGVQAKVLNSAGMKALEGGGAKAFITRFASGHTAAVQRVKGETYTLQGAVRRIDKYGRPHNQSWPDMTRLKKLLSPAVPHMLGNESVRENARELLSRILDEEITKRIDKALKKGGAA